MWNQRNSPPSFAVKKSAPHRGGSFSIACCHPKGRRKEGCHRRRLARRRAGVFFWGRGKRRSPPLPRRLRLLAECPLHPPQTPHQAVPRVRREARLRGSTTVPSGSLRGGSIVPTPDRRISAERALAPSTERPCRPPHGS